MKIALLISFCSRNQNYNTFDDIPFLKFMYPSFLKTKSDHYQYTFYIGIDDDDEYFIQNKSKLEIHNDFKIFIEKNCQHHPVKMWNILFTYAYHDNNDYFFQIGDDVTLLDNHWTSVFINYLEKQNNIGVVGPCNFINYYGRLREGKKAVIENSFVHRTHYNIFNFFFYPDIKNWHCDDWITFVYDKYSKLCINIRCHNHILGSRYKIMSCHDKIDTYISFGQSKLKIYLQYLNY